MMVKEMHQRHQVLLTLITSLVPVTSATMGSSWHAGRSSLLAPDLSTTIGRAGLPSVTSVANTGALQDQDFGAGARFDDDNDCGSNAPVISLSQPAAYTQQTVGESSMPTATAGSLKRTRDGDGPQYHDFQKDAGIEVDERGIIYMAGGRKTGVVPTKIAVSLAMARRETRSFPFYVEADRIQYVPVPIVAGQKDLVCVTRCPGGQAAITLVCRRNVPSQR
jgi:hypothetical protein